MYNTGFLRSNNHLSVVSDIEIKQLEASTGSTVSEWPVRDSNRASPFQSTGNSSRILQTVPSLFGTRQHAPGLISSTPPRHIFNRTLSRRPVYRNWWENHHQKSISHHCQYRVPLDYPESEQLSCSVHLSKYDSIPLSRPHPTFYEPDIMNQIDDAAPHSWKHDHLINAHALLTAAIPNSRNLIHHVLASRAIVRARL